MIIFLKTLNLQMVNQVRKPDSLFKGFKSRSFILKDSNPDTRLNGMDLLSNDVK